MQLLGVITPVVTGTDAEGLFTAIGAQLVAYLPFIVAIVAGGFILRLVISKVKNPLGK